jgi:diguanylate cyclase (GGDEF)-like protein/PAS domain S-box-containing protein
MTAARHDPSTELGAARDAQGRANAGVAQDARLTSAAGDRPGRPLGALMLGFALVVGLIAALIVFYLARTQGALALLEGAVNQQNAAIETVYRMHNALVERAQLVQELVAGGTAATEARHAQRAQLADAGRRYQEARVAAHALPLSPRAHAFLAKQYQAAAETLRLQDEAVALHDQGRRAAAERLLTRRLAPLHNKALTILSVTLAVLFEDSRQAMGEARQQAQHMRTVMLGGGLGVIVLSIAIALGVLAYTRRLLDRLGQTSHELAASVRDLSFQKFALDQHAIVSISDASGKITYANDKLCQVSQYARAELLGQDHRLLNSGLHPREFFTAMWRTIGHGAVWRGVVRNRRKDGSFYWVETCIVPFLNERGRPYQYISIRTEVTRIKEAEEVLQRDKEGLEAIVGARTHELAQANQELRAEVDERRRIERVLEQLATTDTLTGISNRRKLNDALGIEIKRAERFRTPLALVMFDIDRFKQLNDRHGHPIGDRVLAQVAQLVAGNIRAHDVFGRWGGEEFVIVVPGSDLAAARQLAEKLRAEIERTLFASAHAVTCSFGAAEWLPGESDQALIQRADNALYRAKHRGRNRVEIESAA